MRKKIVILLLLILVLPLLVVLKPVWAVDIPQLSADVNLENNKQIYTVKWEVPGGQYWAKTPDKLYAVLYRSQSRDGTYSGWKPMTIGSTSGVVQTTELKGIVTYIVPEKDYGKSFQFSLLDNTSVQAEDTISDAETRYATSLMKSKTAAEAAQTRSFSSSGDEQFWDPTNDKGNIFERIVANLVFIPVKAIKFVGWTAKFESIEQLVFLSGVREEKRQNLPWRSPAAKDKMHKWFIGLMWVTLPLYVFVIAYHGLKIVYIAANPMTRAESMESIQRWFLSLGIVVFTPVLISLFMTISGILIDGIVFAYQGVSTGTASMNPMKDITDIATGSILGTALIKSMFALMELYFNVIYIIRMTAISVMYGFTPLLAVLWAVRKDTPAMAVWMGELASNAFMPAAHGLVIGTILLLCQDFQEGSWAYILIMMYCLIPLSEVLRNSLTSLWTRNSGMNESRVAGNLASLAGLGALLSMGRVGKAALGGRSINSAAAASGIGKSVLKPQPMPNPQRNYASTPPHAGHEKPAAFGSFFKNDPGTAPNINFDRMNYAKFNGKSIYAKHNYHRRPQPSAIKKSRMSANPKNFYYKRPEPDRHQSEILGKAIPAAATAAKIMTAPMILAAGAVPGGTGMAAGAYALTAGLARGGITAAGIGHNLIQARREMGGDTSGAIKKVAGADSVPAGARSLAKTVAGSIIRPTATYSQAMQNKNGLDQENARQAAVKRDKLHARLNPVKLTGQTSQARPHQTSTPPGQPTANKGRAKTEQPDIGKRTQAGQNGFRPGTTLPGRRYQTKKEPGFRTEVSPYINRGNLSE